MRTVYLDEWCWISLNKCLEGKKDYEQYLPFYAFARDQKEKGNLVFPLSVWHLIETQNTGSDSRRSSLATLQGEISNGWTINTFPSIKSYEISCLINGENALSRPEAVIMQFPANMFGYSKDDIEIHGTDTDTASLIKDLYCELSIEINRFAEYAGKYVSLDSMKDDQLDHLRYMHQRRRLPDYSFLEFCMENIQAYFNNDEQLLVLGKALATIRGLSVSEARTALLEEIKKLPSYYVSCILLWELITQKDEEKLKENDFLDIVFLSTAVPYCDCVITEKQWVSFLKKHKMEQLYNTRLCSDMLSILREDYETTDKISKTG